MKLLLAILFLLFGNLLIAQKSSFDFSAIDYKVRFIDATSPDSLAQKLTAPYTTDLQKVRAIFRWITEHVSYRTAGRYKKVSPTKNVYHEIEEDTGVLKPLNVRVAEQVLRKREAVCDGYSRLFQALCTYAGIRSEVIVGFARGDNRGGIKFRSNHSWNAVYIDSNWHLLDVTWASGFINFSGEFVQHFDESYFLASPKHFIYDHFPEDLQWTLLQDPPALREFHQSPFKHSAFIKHKIVSYQPSDGIIEASIGEKLVFEVETVDEAKDQLVVASGTIPESFLMSSLWLFAKPVAIATGNKIRYSFTVEDAVDQWLHIIYKGDVIMRYKLRVKKESN